MSQLPLPLSDSNADADADLPASPEPKPWAGHRVAFTGRLGTLTRREALALIARCGGQFSPTVSQSTTVLVVGASRWPLDRKGRLSRKLIRARLLQQQGGAIEVIDEDTFLSRSLTHRTAEDEERLYVLSDVERILQVSRDRVRTLMRAGLIEPAEMDQGVAFFRFRDIRRVKSLVRLLDQGAPLQRVRRSLQRLRTLFPWADASADGVQWIESWGRHIVLRSPDGSLLETNGQRLMDFDAADERPSVALPRDLYADAVRCEAAQDWAGMAAAYEGLLEQEGADAEICFQLGNALYALDRTQDAAQSFRQAVELDRNYVEAWNNLGNVLAQLQEYDGAIEAYARAVQLDPTWTDARFGLADVLDECGRTREAAKHWRALCAAPAGSEYADYARQRLAHG